LRVFCVISNIGIPYSILCIIREIMQTLEAAALVNATDPLPRCLAEGTFAAQYLLKEDDLIPDSVPGVGLADDAILVKSVVARHGRELARSGWDF
jgi:uncharacterized membrane protein YkvA (DUF1232 family)